MAVKFFTDSPQELLDNFNSRIDQKEAKGKITTWERSKDGASYTHRSEDWGKKAWFKPSVDDGKLVFNIIAPDGKNVSRATYGYYHGHLTETFLNHFDREFRSATSTALAASGDRCSA